MVFVLRLDQLPDFTIVGLTGLECKVGDLVLGGVVALDVFVAGSVVNDDFVAQEAGEGKADRLYAVLSAQVHTIYVTVVILILLLLLLLLVIFHHSGHGESLWSDRVDSSDEATVGEVGGLLDGGVGHGGEGRNEWRSRGSGGRVR